MRRYSSSILAIAMGLALMVPTAAVAHTSRATYEWHVGDAFLVSLGFPVGDQAIAENGDVVTLVGTGTFTADGKLATGGGTFSHHRVSDDATITGTWTADRVISFQFYGCGQNPAGPLPPDFCGGLLKMAITATPDAFPDLHLSGTLWINCIVGTDVPASVIEGVRVIIPGIVHFNKSVLESGANVYIQL
jgi:hypothetical protein